MKYTIVTFFLILFLFSCADNLSKTKKNDLNNDSIIYNEKEFASMNLQELRIKRNEVYARKGKIFKSKDLQKHFKQFDWYDPTNENVQELLSDTDRKNIKLVKELEFSIRFRKRSKIIIEEAKIKFALPNTYWSFKEKVNNDSFTVYTYIRDYIVDSAGRKIDSQISIILEPITVDISPIEYSIQKRIELPFDVVNVFSHEDGSMQFEYGVGFQGKYEDRGIEHRIYIVHGIHNNMGIVLIMDTTEELSDIVAPEFLKTLKTLAIVS